MVLSVRFDDGPAAGREKRYPRLDVALPSLAWTGEDGRVQAVYRRAADGPDLEGFWHYQRLDVSGLHVAHADQGGGTQAFGVAVAGEDVGRGDRAAAPRLQHPPAGDDRVAARRPE